MYAYLACIKCSKVTIKNTQLLKKPEKSVLNKEYNELAQVIDMRGHIDARNRKNGSFSADERKALMRIDAYGQATKVMQEIEFKAADARHQKMGERAFLFLSANPQVPFFEIVKRKGGGFLLHNGHFKEPRLYHDIDLLARHVKGAINNRKAEMNATIYGSPKKFAKPRA